MSRTLTGWPDGTRIDWARRHARMPAFYAITATYLVLLLITSHEQLRLGALAWTPGYGAVTHRVHHVALGGFLTVLVLCVAVQLYRPAERVGAYLLSAIAVGSVLAVDLLTGGQSGLGDPAILVVPVAVIGLLHPGLQSFRPSRATLDARLLALALLAAVPLLAFAVAQVDLQLTATDDHAAVGYYGAMAAVVTTVAIAVVVASFRPAGWRVLAYASAFLLVLVAVASGLSVHPSQGATFGLVGDVLALVWTFFFVSTAEYGAWEAAQAAVADPRTDAAAAGR